jgi:hypothetical protein
MRPVTRLAGFATTLVALGVAGSALASGQTTPPHIAGSKYCQTVSKPGDYTLYGYAKGVGCPVEKAWVAKCELKSGLQGWKLSLSNRYGVILGKGPGTLDLQLAGGSPLCITDALT